MINRSGIWKKKPFILCLQWFKELTLIYCFYCHSGKTFTRIYTLNIISKTFTSENNTSSIFTHIFQRLIRFAPHRADQKNPDLGKFKLTHTYFHYIFENKDLIQLIFSRNIMWRVHEAYVFLLYNKKGKCWWKGGVMIQRTLSVELQICIFNIY